MPLAHGEFGAVRLIRMLKLGDADRDRSADRVRSVDLAVVNFEHRIE